MFQKCFCVTLSILTGSLAVVSTIGTTLICLYIFHPYFNETFEELFSVAILFYYLTCAVLLYAVQTGQRCLMLPYLVLNAIYTISSSWYYIYQLFNMVEGILQMEYLMYFIAHGIQVCFWVFGLSYYYQLDPTTLIPYKSANPRI